MRIDMLTVGGWMPFRGMFTLTLPAGPIAIVGTHAGDTRRSNRAGKTALLEAVTWALFGVHRKRTDDAVINRESDACNVVVTLGLFTVSRSKKRGSPARLRCKHVHGAEMTGAQAQEEIEKVLGLSESDYLATSCFRQGDVEAVIQRTASERLALVSEWLRQSAWLDAKKIQSESVRAADSALGEKRSALNTAKQYTLAPALLQALQDEQTRLEVSKDAKQADIVSCDMQLHDLHAAQSDRERHEQVDKLRGRAGQLRAAIAARREVEERVRAHESARELAATRMSAASSALAELQTVRDGLFDGQCPVMCQQCPVAMQVAQVVAENNALLDDRLHEKTLAEAFYKQTFSGYEAARTQLTQIERQTAEYKSIVENGKELAAGLQYDAELLADLPVEDEIRTALERAQHGLQTTLERMGEVRSMLKASAEASQRFDVLVNEIEGCEDAARASHLALRAIASVPAKLAAEQLSELEQDANQLLSGSGVSVRFSWARELADKAPLCTDCGFVFSSKRADECPTCHAPRGKKLAQELEILCDDGSGVEEDVRFNSGGTKAIVGAALRLAASSMLRRLRDSQAAWAIVDEPFGTLDMENREQLARTFAGMLGSVGLEQALVVSHDPMLLGALPHRIVVDKDGSASTLRFE